MSQPGARGRELQRLARPEFSLGTSSSLPLTNTSRLLPRQETWDWY